MSEAKAVVGPVVLGPPVRVEATQPDPDGSRNWLVLGCRCIGLEFPEFRDAINHASGCAQ